VAIVGAVFALFTAGYILGVWTACMVFRQPQRAYEDGVTGALSIAPVIVLGRASGLGSRRP
jgi:hypothetical protein